MKVSSIRRNKAACRLVRAQQSAALALDIPLSQLRRGMVAISPKSNQPVACQYFQATVCLLFHPTEIVRGFRTTVHIGNIRQTAVIEGMNPVEGMKSNDQRSVMFRQEHTTELQLQPFTNIHPHIVDSSRTPSSSKLEQESCFVREELKASGR